MIILLKCRIFSDNISASEAPTHRGCALDHISAVVLARLQPEELPGALVLAQLVQLLLVLVLGQRPCSNTTTGQFNVNLTVNSISGGSSPIPPG